MAVQAGIAAWRNPGSDVPGGIEAGYRRERLNRFWELYRNSAFEDATAWSAYREAFGLYRYIRPIYNPTKRIVNFYVAQVYPGVLSKDASKLPDGVQLAIPLSEDTDDDLKEAIAQFWQFSNWQSGNRLMVRFGAASGSCLVEVVDNVERGKITTAVRWPGWIADRAHDDSPSLVLDDVGNIKFYALEYDALDGKGEAYKYRKEVSQESYRFFRDDKPYDYGQGVEFDNPYGFVPAVWTKHIDEGDDFGSPAISGSIGKFDELNEVVSHVHDQIHLLIASPGIIASSGNVANIEAQAAAIKTRNATLDEYNALASVREKSTKRMMLKGPEGTSWIPLVGALEPDKVDPSVERLLSEIEHDFPELSMYQELRKMSQVTGPGAARMMGDVYSRVLEVSSNYDAQSIKLFQMAVAIGGFRFAEGKDGWKDKTEQRKKFAPFGLDSYSRGELNFSIMPRPLIPMTEADSIELTGKRLDNAKKAQGVFPDDKVLEIAGISDEDERADMLSELEENSQGAPSAIRGMGDTVPPAVRSLLGATAKELSR
jgi:hypothetical protein